tara:strand:+ start:777 stop:920 length:144 start_codon:yes stop_codon:yes gene_type:complete
MRSPFYAAHATIGEPCWYEYAQQQATDQFARLSQQAKKQLSHIVDFS